MHSSARGTGTVRRDGTRRGERAGRARRAAGPAAGRAEVPADQRRRLHRPDGRVRARRRGPVAAGRSARPAGHRTAVGPRVRRRARLLSRLVPRDVRRAGPCAPQTPVRVRRRFRDVDRPVRERGRGRLRSSDRDPRKRRSFPHSTSTPSRLCYEPRFVTSDRTPYKIQNTFI